MKIFQIWIMCIILSSLSFPARAELTGHHTRSIEELNELHIAWDTLLKEYVSKDGQVNYKGLKSKSHKLEGYLDILSRQMPSSGWSKESAMAYWINLYNAATVKLILDNYPVKSILDIDGGKAWDRLWIKVEDQTYSLNQIEHEILRPEYKDPRIHFAVNCAAKSCPKLLNMAWTENNLENQLDAQTKNFINSDLFNKISKNKLELSKIFEWYGEDFGDLRAFIARYTDKEISPTPKISFKEYNWSLNE